MTAQPRSRCFGDGDPLMADYHDLEWGRPVTDERGLYERICLEGFQAGLSWRTILARRDGFRAAFADFDPDRVARFAAPDVRRLLADAAIIRNRAKIEAAIANARAAIALRDTATPLSALIWSHRPSARRAPRSFARVPASTPQSAALSSSLRAAGFRFVGPTTVYALMQACGLVNDHLAWCPVRAAVEEERVQAARRAAP